MAWRGRWVETHGNEPCMPASKPRCFWCIRGSHWWCSRERMPCPAWHLTAVGGALEWGGGVLCGSLWGAALLRDTLGDAWAKLR